MNLNGLMK